MELQEQSKQTIEQQSTQVLQNLLSWSKYDIYHAFVDISEALKNVDSDYAERIKINLKIFEKTK